MWMIERYPVDTVTSAAPDSVVSTVVMPVTSEQWLRRLLLRLGPTVVVSAPERWSHLAADTARSVLAHYDVVSRDN